MRRRIEECGLFFREFLRNFHSTGAVLPSGRFLATALARHVADGSAARRILEVGPGTGAVTGRIVRAMGPQDFLDLVEVNESFVQRLRCRFETDTPFQRVADRARLLHCLLQELPASPTYDLIISGLPLNNFSVADVQQILDCFGRLVRPGAIISFFEYIAVRSARAIVSSRVERQRLRGIGDALGRVLREHEIQREWIWPNVPPAWVHHLRF